MRKNPLRAIFLTLLVLFTVSICSSLPVKAAMITTPEASIPTMTSVDDYYLTVNSNTGKRTYHIFAQGASYFPPKSYVQTHGCACCSLTTILSGYVPGYQTLNPWQTSQIIEKKIFGNKSWKANYNQKAAKQMPVSLYGITRVLKKNGIKSSYIRKFKDASAVRQIQNHLLQGCPVIIEVNNHRQNNGKVSAKYDQKWSTTKHTMALLGMTDSGKVIVADSAQRAWSGNMQRVKLTTMNELVHYMFPCSKSSNSLYYKSAKSNGGYVLVY